jgi:glycosyltransferase involved in cell wall biosynthesis
MTRTTDDSRSPERTILFIVTEDWFFCSHFQPMARAALAAGFEVAVATRVRDHGGVIEALGCRLLPFEADRKSLNPFKVVGALARMRQLIAAEKPDIIHLIALRSIIVGGLAARLAGVSRRVVALTGMGLIGAAETMRARAARAAIRFYIRTVVDGPRARFLFENRTDPRLLGLDPDDRAKVAIVGGAGVDPDVFRPSPSPDGGPLKLAMIARMLWSKGPDTAVEALRLARAAGANVELSLYGAPDPLNPRSVSEETLKHWAAEPGIRWEGRTAQSDVPAIWAAHHAALLPSRGGEGLPRTLLEAAACGRAILTTDVPGCRDLVRDGIEGLLTAPGDAAALAKSIMRLASDRQVARGMGEAARARVLDGYTEDAVGKAVVALYRALLST